MKNEKLPTRMGSVAYMLTGRHASFIRFCKLFEIDLGKPFDKDHYISEQLSEHLFKFKIFAKLYEADFYNKKSPEMIAQFLSVNDKEIILDALRILKPNCFVKKEWNEEKNLYFFSSFEVDKYLGGNYDFLAYSEM